MKKPQIVNIINFIRAIEPRCEVDLIQPIVEQMRLLNQYGLPSTFLVQYDTMLNDTMVSLLKSNPNPQTEIGLWLEFCQPLMETIGIPWRGKYAWDWHANVGFSVGYTQHERILIIDECMRKFKEVFGFYPKSVGSWTIDTFSIAYMGEKYGIDATCNCKDQWGTDGYTMWGGFSLGGYYPSKKNMFCPAHGINDKINVPLFRMLGSDPIYQYDLGLSVHEGASEQQSVVTLEPVYTGKEGGGGIPKWVDWFFDENYNGKCITFAYAQAGQENSFGWDAMKGGLEYQFPRIAELSQAGRLVVQTLQETGKWYKDTFSTTAPIASITDTDWKNGGRQSAWYCCKNYRINLYKEENRFWIRDIYKFDSNYPEKYYNAVCEKEYLHYDNLPVMDGNRFSGKGIRAGIYPMVDGKPIDCTAFTATDTEKGIVGIVHTTDHTLTFVVEEENFTVTGTCDFTLQFVSNAAAKNLPPMQIAGNTIQFVHEEYSYSVEMPIGMLSNGAEGITIASVDKKIVMAL